MIKLDFAIIGAQKSASTSLRHYLGAHPEIVLPKGEIKYFADNDIYSLGEDYLDRYYKDLAPGMLAGLGNVKLAVVADVASSRLVKNNPEMKIIAVFRNPIDRAYSAYWYHRRNGWEPAQTFEEALDPEFQGKLGQAGSSGLPPYLRAGHYCDNLEPYQRLFGHDRVRILFTEDLAADPVGMVRNLTEWLGVDPSLCPSDYAEKHNRSSAPIFSSFYHLLMSKNSVFKRIYHAVCPRALHRLLNRVISRPLQSGLLRSFVPPPMKPETRQRLREHFAPHIQQISELLKRDLSHWS
jgi:Sulfotransferase domain